MDVTVDYFDTHPTILCRPIPVEKGQTAAERPRSTTFLGLTSQNTDWRAPPGLAGLATGITPQWAPRRR